MDIGADIIILIKFKIANVFTIDYLHRLYAN